MLPNPEPRLARGRDRRLAARVAYGRPGPRARAGRGARGLPQLDAFACGPGPRDRARASRRVRHRICSTRTARGCALRRFCEPRAHSAHRRRRGPLRVAVGPGLPPFVSANRRLHRAAARTPRRLRAHGDGDRARSRRHCAPARAVRPLPYRHRFRPSEPALRRRARGAQAQDRPDRGIRLGARRGFGHRVLLDPEGHRGRVRCTRVGRRARNALPCRAPRCRARSKPAGIHLRRCACHGRR